MAVPGALVHPFTITLNGKKLADKVMCDRFKNIFRGIY
jgi:hypothetical protein